MQVTGLFHVAIKTNDLDATVKFYTGLVQPSVDEKPSDPHYRLLQKGGYLKLDKQKRSEAVNVVLTAKAEQELVTAFDRWGRAGGIELGSIKPQWKRGSSNRYSLLECRVDASGSLNVPMENWATSTRSAQLLNSQ